MTSIASASASTLCPGVSRGPPIATIASQNAPGAEPELDPAAAEDVEAGGAAGEHDRRAQRQVGDVGRDADVGGRRRDDRQQRPGVEEARLVRVVLEADEVQPGDVGEPRELDHGVGLARPPG